SKLFATHFHTYHVHHQTGRQQDRVRPRPVQDERVLLSWCDMPATIISDRLCRCLYRISLTKLCHVAPALLFIFWCFRLVLRFPGLPLSRRFLLNWFRAKTLRSLFGEFYRQVNPTKSDNILFHSTPPSSASIFASAAANRASSPVTSAIV